MPVERERRKTFGQVRNGRVKLLVEAGKGCFRFRGGYRVRRGREFMRTIEHHATSSKLHSWLPRFVDGRGRAADSTFVLNNATRPFILALANKGLPRALEEDAHLRNGLNVYDGKITCRAVADALGLPFTPAEQVLAVA
jgi:hypothetical protein